MMHTFLRCTLFIALAQAKRLVLRICFYNGKNTFLLYIARNFEWFFVLLWSKI